MGRLSLSSSSKQREASKKYGILAKLAKLGSSQGNTILFLWTKEDKLEDWSLIMRVKWIQENLPRPSAQGRDKAGAVTAIAMEEGAQIVRSAWC